MGATTSALRVAFQALRTLLFKRAVVVLCVAGFASGIILPNLLKSFFPQSATLVPHTALAASFFIDLAGLALLLSWLPSNERHDAAWLRTAALLGSCFVCGFAFLGLHLSGTHQESLKTFAVLWALFVAQAAVVAALHAMLWVIFYDARQIAAQATWLVLAAAASALFWSREPIQKFTRSGAKDSALATRSADGVMKLSPPLAVAATWYQASDAARQRGSSDNRFDLIRAHLTYEVWIGSYQALPYPEVTPSSLPDPQGERPPSFNPGLILAMFAWGLPLLLLMDVLLWWREHSSSRVA
jgi:hypothetical protein